MSNRIQGQRVPFEDPLHFFSAGARKLYSSWVGATYPFASNGGKLSVHPTCILSRRIAPRIRIGRSVMIKQHAWINVVPEAEGSYNICIGNNCVINALCTLSARNLIEIEEDVMVSACSLIMDHNHAYEDRDLSIRAQGVTEGGTIRIERGCWIGHGAAVICNQGEVTIGRNSVIAANALVTKSCPPYSVLVGNPARLAKQSDAAKETIVSAHALPARERRPSP